MLKSYPFFLLKNVLLVPGVVVRPGETVKCDPGDFFCHISQVSFTSFCNDCAFLLVYLRVDPIYLLFGCWNCNTQQIALQAGKGNEDVRIFMKVDDKEFLIATLSDDKYPHHKTDLYLEEFELLHSSKTRSISVFGNNFSNIEIKYPFLFLLCLQRSSSMKLCSLTACPVFIHI